MVSRHTLRSTTAACVATIIGVPTNEVPLDDDERAAWLAERGLALVAVAGPETFQLAGPWIALRPQTADPRELAAVTMFGVPSGVTWDPAGTSDEIRSGYIVAALDLAAWVPPAQREPGQGTVETIVIAATAEAPARTVGEAEALPGRGLAGDRYENGTGTFGSRRPGSAITLVDKAVLDELSAELGGTIDHRRNLVVRGLDLDALIGRRFRIGDTVICRGRRRCEPCAHLDRLNGGGVLRPLVHRGGLRADIETGGVIRAGDPITPL